MVMAVLGTMLVNCGSRDVDSICRKPGLSAVVWCLLVLAVALLAWTGAGIRHMSRKRTTESSAAPAVTVLEAVPTPRLNLHNLESIRREMGSVYRDMRGGRIDTQDGSRLVYVLGELRKLIEAADLERRILQLEGKKSDGDVIDA